MSDTISIIYMRNNKGPIMEPWGTPASMVTVFEYTPFQQLRCLRSYTQSSNQSSPLELAPTACNLSMNPLCHTLSNILLISQIITRISLPWLNASHKV